MSGLLLKFLGFASFFSSQKKMFFLTFLYLGKPVHTSAIYTLSVRSWDGIVGRFSFLLDKQWG